MYNLNDLTNIAKGLFGKLINQGFNTITIHQHTETQGSTIYAKARLKNAQGTKHKSPCITCISLAKHKAYGFLKVSKKRI